MRLLKNYLDDRQQSVKCLNTVSSFYIIMKSLSGADTWTDPVYHLHFVFPIYPSKLSMSSIRGRYSAVLFFQFQRHTRRDACSVINQDLEYIYNTFKQHCLTINSSKSAAMMFGRTCDIRMV